MIHQLNSYMLVIVVEGSSVYSCILLVVVYQPVHIYVMYVYVHKLYNIIIHTYILELSDSENNTITIAETMMFKYHDSWLVWICSVYQFINTMIKGKEI